MQKSSLVIFIVFISVFTAHAQLTKPKVRAHPIADSITVAICNCILKQKDTLNTLERLYGALDICLKNSSPALDDLLKEDGFVQKDDRKARAAAVRDIGKKLGQRVVDECSGFKTILNTVVEQEKKKQLH